MRIHDEELGPMRWHLQLSEGKITAEAVVETSRVQELLRNHQDVLEAKLNALGVEVEDFEVSVDRGSQEFTPSPRQDGSTQTDPSNEKTVSCNDTERSGMSEAPKGDQGLDLYV